MDLSCRLCLKNITDHSFHIIDDITRAILDVLLLKLKFHDESKEVICNDCRKKLNTASEFKLMCLNTNKTIISHVDCDKLLQLDLGEFYVKKYGNGHLIGSSYDYTQVCRLCMRLIKGEIRSIGEEEVTAIHEFLPEMNVSIIKNPVLCISCFDSLYTHNTFIKDCLEVEEKIRDKSKSSIACSKTDVSSYLFVKSEDADNEFETNEGEMLIKSECVEIKSEEDEERSDTSLVCWRDGTFENDCKNVKEEEHEREHQVTPDNPLFKCDKCIYETGSKTCFTNHCAKHKNDSKVYKCDSCEYVTNRKHLFKSHRLRHKDPAELQMYKCDSCDYESRYKSSISQHQLMHKSPSQVQMYGCDYCGYRTKYKNDLAKHVLKHKDSSEVQMYECDDCDFRTRYKKSLTVHQLKHRDPGEVKMVESNCNYKTPSQVQMYKCGTCDYESKHKHSFTRHQSIHKDPSQAQMYKCDTCNFETCYKQCLEYHELIHKRQSRFLKSDQC